jgi:hypothetical protein
MATDLEIRKVTFDEALAAGVEDLLIANWTEAAPSQHERYPLDPDWPKYKMLERMGLYHAVGAWAGGQLVGYSGYFVQPTMHNRTSVWAVNDLLFLNPAHRRGPAAARIVLHALAMLRGLRVDRVVHSVKAEPHSPAGKRRARLANLFVRLGFEPEEDVYILDL